MSYIRPAKHPDAIWKNEKASFLLILILLFVFNKKNNKKKVGFLNRNSTRCWTGIFGPLNIAGSSNLIKALHTDAPTHTHTHTDACTHTHTNTQSTSLLTGQAFSALSHAVFNWPHTGSLAVPNALLPPTNRESMNACKYAHSFSPLLLCHTTALNAIFCFSATQTLHRNVSGEGEKFGHTSNLFKTLKM